MIRTALILLISLFGTKIFSQDAKLIYKNAANSTVTIETDKGLGSGFFVGNNIIATNYHVIEGATAAYCYLNNSNTKYNIEGFLAIDTSADLVLLKVEGLNRTSLKMATKSVEVGQKIFVLGSPKGLPATISDGLVSGLRNFNGHKFIQITAPISPGSSGGPILNSNGELEGVSVGQINGGQNLNFAIPKSYLQLLLNSKKSTIETLTNLPITKVSSSRSKIETQEWIKEKIEGFSRSFNKPEYDNYGSYKFEVTFTDCNIKIINKWRSNLPWPDGSRYVISVDYVYLIPLKSLAKLNFILLKTDYQIVFSTKSNEALIEFSEIDPEKTKKTFVNTESLYIPQELLNNNLPERLTNAFNNLIELCGGKVTKEIF